MPVPVGLSDHELVDWAFAATLLIPLSTIMESSAVCRSSSSHTLGTGSGDPEQAPTTNAVNTDTSGQNENIRIELL